MKEHNENEPLFVTEEIKAEMIAAGYVFEPPSHVSTKRPPETLAPMERIIMKARLKSMVTVFQVRDMASSLDWYRKWLGEPDVLPAEGMAEYQVNENAWLQLGQTENEPVQPAAVVFGVEDAEACRQELLACGIEAGELVDYEVVLLVEILDPDGNRISFAQEV